MKSFLVQPMLTITPWSSSSPPSLLHRHSYRFVKTITTITNITTNTSLVLNEIIRTFQSTKVFLLLLTLGHLLCPASPSDVFHLSVGQIWNLWSSSTIDRRMFLKMLALHRCVWKVFGHNDNVWIHSNLSWLCQQATFPLAIRLKFLEFKSQQLPP